MDTNTLSPIVAAATLSSTSVHAGNRNFSTDPKRMAVSKVWDSMMCGARKYYEEQGVVKLHSGAGVGIARVAQFTLSQTDIRKCVPFLINRENVI